MCISSSLWNAKDASLADLRTLTSLYLFLSASLLSCLLCYLARWIEACINEEIDAITTLEESLRNGVVLAKLARFFDPTSVRKIFEVTNSELAESVVLCTQKCSILICVYLSFLASRTPIQALGQYQLPLQGHAETEVARGNGGSDANKRKKRSWLLLWYGPPFSMY